MSNKIIIDEFVKLINNIKDQMDNEPDKKKSIVHSYRLRQTQNVLNILKKYPSKITNASDLSDVKGIGKHSIERIHEILQNGSLKELDTVQPTDIHKNINNLEQVIGIGRKKAIDLIKNHNIHSVIELKHAIKNNKIQVNDKILLGLKYYGKIKQNIPRAEINTIDNFLHKIISSINIELFGVICGSYRRQKTTSNDIDLLIVHPNIITLKQLENNDINYLQLLVDKLKKKSFLIDDLTDKNYVNKYMGFCKFKSNPIRRIDIRYMPYKSYYPALLYFTGSGEFNKKMRQVAIQLGYKLNEYGLYKILDGKYKRINVQSEKDIFDELNMEYIDPELRT